MTSIHHAPHYRVFHARPGLQRSRKFPPMLQLGIISGTSMLLWGTILSIAFS